ncbi:MAG: peptidoglycan DD-metalloendopeptidase family protein [Candidatus Tectomicrobia bacterium]|nr:peptidoglycan DD-metalloendopeptidase family protein [Candidatus Tectomicrobia bacterium]
MTRIEASAAYPGAWPRDPAAAGGGGVANLATMENGSFDLRGLAQQLDASRGDEISRNLSEALQRREGGGDDAELREAVHKFEALFVHFMLQQMRATIERSSLFGQGQSMEIYESLLDQEVATEVAKQGGLGLGERLLQQLQQGSRAAAPRQHASGALPPAGLPAEPWTEPPQGVSAGEAGEPPYEPHSPAAAGEVSPPPQSYRLPVQGTISSAFGVRHDPYTAKLAFHQGVDLAAPEGARVRAAKAGTVVFSGAQPGHGNTIIIDHGDGYTTQYSHNASNHVRPGARVAQGEVIAEAGSTGRSTGPHVHFEMRRAGRAVNPLVYLEGDGAERGGVDREA